MKVAAFNGSPRKDGNTAQLVRVVFQELEEAGIQTELVQLAGTHPHGCTACGLCGKNKNQRCAQADDAVNEWIAKMVEADGIILASPTYFADVTSELKALIDRAGYVSMANGGLFKRKVGAAVVAVRRGGAIHAVDTINHFLQIQQMIVPGTRYWNFAIGRNIGDVQGDEEGLATMRTLGENMAWLLGKLAS
ncbi:MAG: flavodoxin family protein [Armatimonadota bacterium]